MSKNTLVKQYTIRNIPNGIDRILRRRAKELGKSFNQVVLEAIISGAGESISPTRDLSSIAGSMSDDEAKKMEEEIRLQRQVDAELWK